MTTYNEAIFMYANAVVCNNESTIYSAINMAHAARVQERVTKQLKVIAYIVSSTHRLPMYILSITNFKDIFSQASSEIG